MSTPLKRNIVRVETTPPPAPGFIGEGHTAVEVVTPDALELADPFVLLMDDRLDIARRRQIGGAHPHAGIETVTLVLEGTLFDRDEGALSEGDVLWMSAGRGIIHNEAVEVAGRARILQLWIRLPQRERSSAPGFQLIRASSTPVRHEPGATARLYSGTTGALTSPTHNRAPITMVDIKLAPGGTLRQALPVSYNGFVYVIEGAAVAGGATLEKGQVGWLDAPSSTGSGELELSTGSSGARLVLYAGEPQREPLVHYGPFVAGSTSDLRQLFGRFQAGEFESMSAIARRAHAP